MSISPYPNNPRRSPIEKSEEQKQKETGLKTRMGLEMPILEWLKEYLTKSIADCDSIDMLSPDLNDPEKVVRQIASLKMLKAHLKRMEGEIEKRMKIAKD